MLIIPMPESFKVGDTADVLLNGEPARITYKNTALLVIEPPPDSDVEPDVRAIMARQRSGTEFMFYCSSESLE